MTRSEISRYLLREQGFDEEQVRQMSLSELKEIYNEFHYDAEGEID